MLLPWSFDSGRLPLQGVPQIFTALLVNKSDYQIRHFMPVTDFGGVLQLTYPQSHTRRAYIEAVRQFSAFCAEIGIG